MNDFKGRHFGGEIVLWAVCWYCRYAVSYRDLEARMTERGGAGDHSKIYRRVQHFAPEMEKHLRWPQSRNWRIDETYVKGRGQPARASVFYVPTTTELRARVGKLTAWAREFRVDPRYAGNLLRRHGGRTVDLGRVWGEDSRRILQAAAAAMQDSWSKGRKR